MNVRINNQILFLIALLSVVCARAQELPPQQPKRLIVPEPIELPVLPNRPVQLVGTTITIARASEWMLANNLAINAARERLSQARLADTNPQAIKNAELDLAEVIRREWLAMQRAFYEAVCARLLQYEARENLGFYDNYINRWQARYEEGLAPESEARKWKLERARFEETIANLKLEERLARIRLFAAFGQTNSNESLAVHATLEPAPDSPLPFTLERLRELGLRTRPDLQQTAAPMQPPARLRVATEIEAALAAVETHRARAADMRARQYAEVEYLRGVAASYYNEYETQLITLLDAQRTRWEVRQTYQRALCAYYISLAELEAAVGTPLQEVTP